MEQDHQEWHLNTGHASSNKFKKFAADHPEEYSSLFANFDKIKVLLDVGNKVGAFKVGFFRSEGRGVYRIGQTKIKNAAESRLYVYPDQESRVIYIISIGTKNQQATDIKAAQAIAVNLRAKSSDT